MPGFEMVNGNSKIFLPLTGTVPLYKSSVAFESKASIPKGHTISGAFIICRFPDPLMMMASLPSSSVLKLFFSTRASISKLPTAPLKFAGLFASGNGLTIIVKGLFCKVTL